MRTKCRKPYLDGKFLGISIDFQGIHSCLARGSSLLGNLLALLGGISLGCMFISSRNGWGRISDSGRGWLFFFQLGWGHLTTNHPFLSSFINLCFSFSDYFYFVVLHAMYILGVVHLTHQNLRWGEDQIEWTPLKTWGEAWWYIFCDHEVRGLPSQLFTLWTMR